MVVTLEEQPPTGELSFEAIQERPCGQLPDETERNKLDRGEEQVDILTVTVEAGVKVNHALGPVRQGVAWGDVSERETSLE